MKTYSYGGGRVKTTSKSARYTGGLGESRIIKSSSSQTRTSSSGGGARFDTGYGSMGYASTSVTEIKQGKSGEGGTIIYRAGSTSAGGKPIDYVQPIIKEKKIYVDTGSILKWNKEMKEQGYTAGSYLTALKTGDDPIQRAKYEKAYAGLESEKKKDMSSFEKAVLKQEKRDVKVYQQRERIKTFTRHYIKGDSWLARAGRSVLMLPYDTTVGLGSSVASAVDKTYLFGRAVIDKGANKSRIGKELVSAGKKTPRVLAETFDVRTPEGAVAVASVLAFTYIGGKAIKSHKAGYTKSKTGSSAKKVHVSQHSIKKGFRKFTDYLEITKKGKNYGFNAKTGKYSVLSKKGFKQSLEKIGLRKSKVEKVHPDLSYTKSQLAKKTARYNYKLEKNANKLLLKQKVQESKLLSENYKKYSTPESVLRQRALAQARTPNKLFGSKSYRKAVRTQFRLEVGQRSGYNLGKQSYYYKVSKSQASPVKTSFLKSLIKNKKGQQQQQLLLKYKTKVDVKPKVLKTNVKTSILKPKYLLTAKGLKTVKPLVIPITSVMAGGLIKPRGKFTSISKPKFKTFALPKFKTDVVSKQINIPKVKTKTTQTTKFKTSQAMIPSLGLASALGITSSIALPKLKSDLLKDRSLSLKFDWPGGGGGRGGGLSGWYRGFREHKLAYNKLL